MLVALKSPVKFSTCFLSVNLSCESLETRLFLPYIEWHLAREIRQVYSAVYSAPRFVGYLSFHIQRALVE